MSRRRRGRITVQSQPTGATRAVRRMAGVVQVIFGLVFVVVAVTQIMPLSPLFSLPFLAMGALAVVMGVLSAVGKNGLPHRVGYDVETGIEEETIAGLMEDVDKTEPLRRDPRPHPFHRPGCGRAAEAAGGSEKGRAHHPGGVSGKAA